MKGEKVFHVKGEILEKGEKKPFKKTVRAQSAGFAVEKALCLFGSKNKLKRKNIIIKEAKEGEEIGGKKRNADEPPATG